MSEPKPIHLRVFLGAPGDATDERSRATRALENLPLNPMLSGLVTVQVVASDGVPMHAGDTPQEAVPLPSSCDIAVFIFRERMGTPLPRDFRTKSDGSPFRSGTEYECAEALAGAEKRGKPFVLVYRWNGKPTFVDVNPEVGEQLRQWEALQEFFGEFRNAADDSLTKSHHGYDDPARFEALLTSHLLYRIRELLDPSLPSPNAEEQYRLGRIAQWSKPEHQLDKRFVRLTLLIDEGESAPGVRWQSRGEFDDLRDVLRQLPDPALVVLGPPGSGKSTLLRRFELDTAVASLRDESQPMTFFVELNRHRARERGGVAPPPSKWLGEQWTERFPGLPSLDALLREGRMALLLDGLNEMPQGAGEDYLERVSLWRDFVTDLVEHHPGNRVVFSCRSLNYSAPLSSPALRVPQVRVESLTPDQAREFVRLYIPDHAEAVWKQLERSTQLELFRVPYFLKLLADEVSATGAMPQGRAGLFTGLVRRALRREVERDNHLFRNDAILDPRDRRKVTQSQWRDDHELPLHGVLIPRLVALADGMQRRRAGGESTRVRVDHGEAIALISHDKAEDLLSSGAALGVLDEDLVREEVQFFHQLLQEYFAARGQALRPEPELGNSPWRTAEMKPSLEEALLRLSDSDPLPPSPATGWEETMLLAGAMTRDPDLFVRDLARVNLPLAARCAAQADVKVSEVSKAQIRRDLIGRTADHDADLRARIEAGMALGVLGDPRFERGTGPEGEFLLPPLVSIRAGEYPIGSDEGIKADEEPAHVVPLAAFEIAAFPVTNGEWACFMAAGGYEVERWWETDAARAWRRGEGTDAGPKEQYRELRQWVREHPSDREGWTSVQVKDWERYANMDDVAFERLMSEWCPPGRQFEPRSWNNDAYNLLSQPVVGVCWHEARAYCAWLSRQSERTLRLPSEVEWEAAARGKANRTHTFGTRFNAARCNTFESHIRRSTPVDVFPSGKTPEGVADMTGNVWEWTSSLYKSYRYDVRDGREDAAAPGRRVLRGGSWLDFGDFARAVYRLDRPPDFRLNDFGFRVVCSSPITR